MQVTDEDLKAGKPITEAVIQHLLGSGGGDDDNGGGGDGPPPIETAAFYFDDFESVEQDSDPEGKGISWEEEFSVTRGGLLLVQVTFRQRFPSGPRNWETNIHIDGEMRYYMGTSSSIQTMVTLVAGKEVPSSGTYPIRIWWWGETNSYWGRRHLIAQLI